MAIRIMDDTMTLEIDRGKGMTEVVHPRDAAAVALTLARLSAPAVGHFADGEVIDAGRYHRNGPEDRGAGTTPPSPATQRSR